LDQSGKRKAIVQEAQQIIYLLAQAVAKVIRNYRDKRKSTGHLSCGAAGASHSIIRVDLPPCSPFQIWEVQAFLPVPLGLIIPRLLHHVQHLMDLGVTDRRANYSILDSQILYRIL